MLVHDDCRHFRGDRPCGPHKREGVHCQGCPHHDPVRERILVVKLDSVGDVLRTTCILPGLRAVHPGARIDWLTRDDAVPLFDGNPMVDRVVPFPGVAWSDLLASGYDVVINLDAAPQSARLATIARADRRIGFGYDPRGHVFPWNDAAREWFEMGLFDDVKSRNRKTYQQIVSEICGLEGHDRSLRLYPTDVERETARGLASRWGLRPGRALVGLNTGAGRRWEHKKWTEDGFVELIGLLRSDSGRGAAPGLLLLGGPEEAERNRRIAGRAGGMVIDAGTGHSLRGFIAIVDLCDVLVTGDTMALHVAAALGKKIVAVFGPTSAAEIDLYGRGIKIVSDAPCVGCYRTACDVKPTCMERIPAGEVFRAVRDLL